MRTTFEEACKAGRLTAAMLNEFGPEEALARVRDALRPTGWTIDQLADEARRRMHERIAAMRRCACGHSDERHVECVDFTSATGCFEEGCNCQKYRPPESR